MDLAIFSRDTIIILIFIIALISFSYKTRKKATVTLIISLYSSLALYYWIKLIYDQSLSNSVSFLIATVVSFLVIKPFIKGSTPEGGRAFLEHLLLGLSNILLIIAIINHTDALSILPTLQIPFIDLINKTPVWVWFLQPLLVLFVVKKRD